MGASKNKLQRAPGASVDLLLNVNWAALMDRTTIKLLARILLTTIWK